jgi:excisionase family DNA binding protein
MSQRVFTTGQVAKLCHVSQQQIIRLFDAGRLTGFKIPGSRARRIPREKLVEFMKGNQIPLDGLEEIRTKRFSAKCFVVSRAANCFQAGQQCAIFKPDYLVLDFANQASAEEIICSADKVVHVVAALPEFMRLPMKFATRGNISTNTLREDLEKTAEEICMSIFVSIGFDLAMAQPQG